MIVSEEAEDSFLGNLSDLVPRFTATERSQSVVEPATIL